MDQIIININRAKMNAEAWQGFLTMHPLPEENPPDVSDDAGKLAYMAAVMKQHLAHVVRRGVELNQRAAVSVSLDITE